MMRFDEEIIPPSVGGGVLGALRRRTEDCVMPFEDASCARSGAIAVKIENVETVGAEAVPAVVEQLANAAEGVSDEREAKAVLHALSHTPGLSECAIAPDVLAKLLPDDEVVELPKLARVNGGLAYRIAKRAFDVASCSLALAILAIPMGVIALKVKRESSGPAIYAQTRVGRDGRLFKVYKFRSMYLDAEAKGAQWAAGDDPRVTPFGRKLRTSRMASVIIGTPGDGESTKSLPRSANSSLDLQLCERRPGLCCIARPIITYLIFLSSAFFGGQVGVLKRSLRAVDVVSDGRVCAVAQTACAAVPLAEDWTVTA